MSYIKQSEFVFDCTQCHTRCDGISKGTYTFDSDVSFSEKYEQLIISRLIDFYKVDARKCNEAGFPDIEIMDKDKKLVRYLEVKVQQRTFMSVNRYLPLSGLAASETVALNLSDLLRYFKIKIETGIPTTIVWVLLNRLCIVPQKSFLLFFQSSDKLKEIYQLNKGSRTFRRRSGEGDVVDGVHKGVTVNYHFSLKELKQWNW